MHDPQEPHFAALKRIIRYLKGTVHHSLHLSHSPLKLSTYSDADWGVAPTLGVLLPGIASFLDPILSLGQANGNPLSSIPARKSGTAP